MEIWGHRGASGDAPENTIEAFALAIKQGATGVELDVQLSRDGEVVVIHDETVDRVSNGTGEIRNYTLEELKALNVNKTCPSYQRVQIPLFEEVCELLAPTGCMVNVELKTGIFWYPQIEEKTLEIVRKYHMEEKVIFSSFNHYSVVKMKQLDSQLKTGILFSDVIYDVCGYAKKLGVDALHPALYHTKMDGVLDAAKENDLKVHVWTVNELEDMQALKKQGVDAIITNYPRKAR